MKKHFFLLFLIFSSQLLFSQHTLNGVVVSQNNTPVEFAEIVLKSTVDSLVSSSSLTNAEGRFSFDKVKNGNYQLEISYASEIVYSRNLNITNDTNLGDIKISTSTNIKGVTISAKRKVIEREVDRLVFNVPNSIAATGKNGLELLEITPRVKVQNDKISIIGKGEVKVMVDDRMVHLSGDDLSTFFEKFKSGRNQQN